MIISNNERTRFVNLIMIPCIDFEYGEEITAKYLKLNNYDYINSTYIVDDVDDCIDKAHVWAEQDLDVNCVFTFELSADKVNVKSA